MEPKKDISIYKTKDGLIKNQRIFAIDDNNSSNNNKELTTGSNIPPFDFNDFVNKKTKKLTTALYMVTSFLSDSEPLKWKLRERSVSLLSGVSNVRYESVSEVDNVFAEYSVLIDEILSLLNIAVSAKLVSEMNYLILQKEYFVLNDAIVSNEYMAEKSGKFIFTDEFFGSDDGLIQTKNKKPFLNENIHIKNKSNEVQSSDKKTKNLYTEDKGHSLNTLRSNSKNISKGQQHQLKRVKDKDVSIRKNKTPASVKIDRRSIILKLFKNEKGSELTIKDISHEVSDCSEKTIQRELISLVADGVLKKYGERRWSRYSLK